MAFPLLRPDQIANADLVLCAHDHIDPTALPGIVQAARNAMILVPGVARDKVVGWGIAAQQVVVSLIDAPGVYGPAAFIAIPAAHEAPDYTPGRGYPHNTEPPGYFVDYVFAHDPAQKIKVMARHEGFVHLKA